MIHNALIPPAPSRASSCNNSVFDYRKGRKPKDILSEQFSRAEAPASLERFFYCFLKNVFTSSHSFTAEVRNSKHQTLIEPSKWAPNEVSSETSLVHEWCRRCLAKAGFPPKTFHDIYAAQMLEAPFLYMFPVEYSDKLEV